MSHNQERKDVGTNRGLNGLIRETSRTGAADSGFGASQQPDDDSDTQSVARSIGNQRSPLSGKRLLVAFPTLCAALFVSFFDQTSVSTCIPAISAELNTGEATSWIGASFLISSTAFQLINGRLSDIFGRKNLLLACLALLGVGDLLCGFARNATELFAFRAVAGIGGGGVNSIVMIIVSDITTLQNRGKYQGQFAHSAPTRLPPYQLTGIIGAVLALANGIGPFLGGAVIEKATWRWVFWMVPMLSIPAALVIWFALPLRYEKGDYVTKVKKIDFGGIVLSLAAVLLFLVSIQFDWTVEILTFSKIPLSGGGVSYAWNSATFIAMFTIGVLVWVGFVLYEWKVARIPIMPLRLYVVLGYSALISGALFLPVVMFTSAASIGCGQYMARYFRYTPSVVLGFAIWTLANGLTCMFNRNTGLGALIPILALEGCGVGLTLQPISGAILSNTLSDRLSGLPFITGGMLASLTSSTYSSSSLGLTPTQKDIVLGVYMEGLRYSFIFYTICTAIGMFLSLGIGNTHLDKEKTVKRPDEESQSTATGLGDAIAERNQAQADEKGVAPDGMQNGASRIN
ncbi:uncharacterized protein JN550_009110 [Neoarthrinium moseri]|uniref:uncharacterized protein n=1 Tax=Neoarthrinium moseri TaxID=1658444 RepID=UPI001FDC67C6|nr:uncharacterized protein JN550_009110 [Neoarthrinium moseri]KAI1864090.1 hypothetical protein JN550_009110 [Neoarthrinium moseri]